MTKPPQAWVTTRHIEIQYDRGRRMYRHYSYRDAVESLTGYRVWGPVGYDKFPMAEFYKWPAWELEQRIKRVCTPIYTNLRGDRYYLVRDVVRHVPPRKRNRLALRRWRNQQWVSEQREQLRLIRKVAKDPKAYRLPSGGFGHLTTFVI